MALKQAFLSVKQGQRVTAFVKFGEDGHDVTGYLAGLDQECWFILQPGETGFRQMLVNRSFAPVLEIHTERTYDQEALRREMDEVIVHFRTWILKNVLIGRS